MICLHSLVSFCICMAVSLSASNRINNLLTSKRKDAAILTAKTVVVFTILAMGMMALTTYFLRSYLGYVFTNDKNIIFRVKQLAPLVAIWQAVLGLKIGLDSILRGTYYQSELLG